MSGTLWGVGVGPGDPDLMTLRAHRLIAGAEVIAYPAPETGESFARRIAASTIPATAEEIAIRIPMRPDRFPAQEIYDQAAEAIGAHLAAGQDVVTLCEGDPFFYGSFMYLHARLAPQFPCVTVPGVNSVGAASAAAHLPLCARNDVLQIVPAPLEETALTERLARPGAAVVIKLGRHLAKVRRVLATADRMEGAVYISHASLPEERVLPLKDAPEAAPYFSLILIPGADPYAS